MGDELKADSQVSVNRLSSLYSLPLGESCLSVA